MEADGDFEDYRREANRYLWEEIEPRAADWDGAGELPVDELWPDLRELGFLSARLPPEYGGRGLSHREFAELEKSWAAVSGGLRVVLHAHHLGVELVARAGTPAQRERLLPQVAEEGLSVAFALTEPHAGSGRDIETALERDGAGYALTGEKHHITNAAIADLIAVVCRSPSGFSIALVPEDANGLTIREMPEMMGNRGASHGYLAFESVAVPPERVLGSEGDGMAPVLGTLRASRAYVAAMALGISERCLEAALDWAKQRVTFGKPIAERTNVRESLAEMARDVYALRLVVDDALERLDAGTATLEPELAKLLATDVNRRVTDTAMLVFGGLGYNGEFPVERLYRDARLNWIEEGTPSIQKALAASRLLEGDLPHEPTPSAAERYDLDGYDPAAGDDYGLSYELTDRS